jgi:4-nitrophenyl phosphatase
MDSVRNTDSTGEFPRLGSPGAAPVFPQALRLVALDLDGVVWRGDRVFAGAREALEDVLRRGFDLRYVSNNSTAHRETVSERLAAANLPAGAERVLTSGFVCGRWLRERFPEGSPVMVVGEQGLLRELREAGLDAYHATETREPAGPEAGAGVDSGARAAVAPMTGTPVVGTPVAVVVGMDRSFTYKTLMAAQTAICEGALYVVTNSDATFPTAQGLVPGAGSIVAAVSAAAQREPILVGKPSLVLAEALATVTGVPAAQTLFVGDRLSTDIAMAKEAGMVAALVLTGVTTDEDLWRAEITGEWVLPDHVLEGLRDLPGLLDLLSV